MTGADIQRGRSGEIYHFTLSEMVSLNILTYATDWADPVQKEETTTMFKNSTLLSTAFLLALPVFGCDGDKDDTGGTDTDTTDTDTDESITPAEGEWFASTETIVEDTCGFEDNSKDNSKDTGEDDEEPVTLTLTGATSFTLNDGDKFNLSCTFDTTGVFGCDDQVEVSDFTVHSIDAILTMTQSFSGTFSSSTEGIMNMSINAACEGEDCDFVSKKGGLTLPCSTSMTVAISHGG